MTVKEMQEYLKSQPEDAELYFTVWKTDGETRYRTRLSIKDDRHLSVSKKFLRITWVDDCYADMISDNEFIGG